MITDTVKLNAVIETLKGEEPKSRIAKKFGISPRSLDRYIEKFKSEAEKFVKEPQMESKVEDAQEVEASVESTNGVMSFMVQQATVEPIVAVPVKTKASSTRSVTKRSAGTPTVKSIVLEVLSEYKANGKVSKEFRQSAVDEISTKANIDTKLASKYYAGYRKMMFV